MAVISKRLNHKNQATTAFYAPLGLEPVRESVEWAASAMLAAGGGIALTEHLPTTPACTGPPGGVRNFV